MIDICPICESQNIIKNNFLKKDLCCYCFLNINDNSPDGSSHSIDIVNLFKNLYPINNTYKNSILISNTNFIKDNINISELQLFQYDSFNEKNISKLLAKGKIDKIIIPDISYIRLKSILSLEKLYSNDINIYLGIFTPDFIIKNLQQFENTKYIYSLYTVSKICTIYKFDIYDTYNDTDYMLLNIKRGISQKTDINNKLQNLWDSHILSPIFSVLE